MRTIILIGMVLCSSSCTTLQFWKSDTSPTSEPTELQEESTGVAGPPPAAPSMTIPRQSSVDELELKLAKTWAKIEDLEQQIQRDRQRMGLIEKGLITGMLPEDLKVAETAHEAQPSKKTLAPAPASDWAIEESIKTSTTVPSSAPPADLNVYKQQLAKATDQYRSGQYGTAVAALSSMAQEYDPSTGDGAHMFWLAKSWIGLKEFQQAKDLLDKFVKVSVPQNPFFPRAKLELAKTLYRLNYAERARKTLEEVIKSYPNDEVAEIAKNELDSMRRNL